MSATATTDHFYHETQHAFPRAVDPSAHHILSCRFLVTMLDPKGAKIRGAPAKGIGSSVESSAME